MGEQGEGLRILFVAPYYKPNWGGIERAIAALDEHLRAAGHHTAILATHFVFPRRWQGGLPDRETLDGGLTCYRVPASPRRAPPFFSVPLVWFPPHAFAMVLADFRPDVIHWVGDGWFWGHWWTWWHGHRRAGIVFTPSFHALRPAYRWLQPLNIVLTRLADRVTVLSAVERRGLARTYLAARRRVRHIGWGVDTPPADGHIPQGWEAGRLTVLCVGRLGEHKGQEWLLDRLLAVRRRLPADLAPRLVLVGRDEGGEATLRARLHDERLDDLVLLTGEVDDVELRRWYAHADLLALFSRYEAFGLVYLEALGYGLPVLTHAVGATAELLPPGSGATVVPPFDATAAEAALIALLASGERRADLGSRGRATAAGYAWATVADRFVAVYREAIARRDRRNARPGGAGAGPVPG